MSALPTTGGITTAMRSSADAFRLWPAMYPLWKHSIDMKSRDGRGEDVRDQNGKERYETGRDPHQRALQVGEPKSSDHKVSEIVRPAIWDLG